MSDDLTDPKIRLRAIRIASGLTQIEMATRIGCNWDTYRRYEWAASKRGTRVPSTRFACSIRDVTAELGDEIDPGDWHFDIQPKERKARTDNGKGQTGRDA